MIKSRIEQLRKIMDEKDIYAYIIPSSDFHQSEYVGEYFKVREYISGFTGSAGTVIITKNEAG
ncbi:aminopeptidase P family N-terminal domain-containing protein, partial [Romboutsia sp. 13368]|uniref:aminopeptidase P family N-terminal domain-containing protein n=1 Tax=Romboutsia sp. 13368 TaxID=2708053 RepID=UPI0025DC770F